MIKLFKKKQQPVTEYLMQFKEFICNYKFHKTLSPRLFIRNQLLKKINITFAWHILKGEKNQIPQPCWYSVD